MAWGAPTWAAQEARLHQAALTFSKLRVHDSRGGALEKGVVLVRKASVTCQRREDEL